MVYMSDLSTSAILDGVDPAQPREVLARVLERLHPHVALASSFSLEDAVLLHLLVQIRPDARVFALDTGRLNPETYECAEALRRRYGVKIEWYFPRHEAWRNWSAKGLFSFKESVENRKECCGIRKVDPLHRALSGLRAWITGLRREQSQTRTELAVVEADASHAGLMKINPLAAWTLEDVWAFTREHKIPYNRLYDQGYASIGCAPCTRAIQPGEDQRAGRWWWENPEHKECGLHLNMKSPGLQQGLDSPPAFRHLHLHSANSALHPVISSKPIRLSHLDTPSKPNPSTSCAKWRRSFSAPCCCSPAARIPSACCAWPRRPSARPLPLPAAAHRHRPQLPRADRISATSAPPSWARS
jgi:phosphoadenosine phosphosulfate reductase